MISFNFHFAVLGSPPVVLPSGRADRNHAWWIEGALDGKRQAEGLSFSTDRPLRDLGIDRVDRELNIERGRDGRDFS